MLRYPKDWVIPLGVAFSVYGWGHNHRGQLGGVEGNKIKTPRLCEAFSELSPVNVIGGEQTMFALTRDGKVTSIACSVTHCSTFSISLPLPPSLSLFPLSLSLSLSPLPSPSLPFSLPLPLFSTRCMHQAMGHMADWGSEDWTVCLHQLSSPL